MAHAVVTGQLPSFRAAEVGDVFWRGRGSHVVPNVNHDLF